MTALVDAQAAPETGCADCAKVVLGPEISNHIEVSARLSRCGSCGTFEPSIEGVCPRCGTTERLPVALISGPVVPLADRRFSLELRLGDLDIRQEQLFEAFCAGMRAQQRLNGKVCGTMPTSLSSMPAAQAIYETVVPLPKGQASDVAFRIEASQEPKVEPAPSVTATESLANAHPAPLNQAISSEWTRDLGWQSILERVIAVVDVAGGAVLLVGIGPVVLYALLALLFFSVDLVRQPASALSSTALTTLGCEIVVLVLALRIGIGIIRFIARKWKTLTGR